MTPEPWKWTESDLLSLIDLGVQESLELDYKRCDALQRTDSRKNEISKDVSAFANSAGGTIVYGVVEDGHVPRRIDVGFDPDDISKEWIEQVIGSRIQRRINGIRINQVSLTTSSPGRVGYVVHVPQSSHAPHQAADKRFYKRFNFESVPMEEYELRDIMNRATAPDLELTFAFRDQEKTLLLTPENEQLYEAIDLVAIVRNISQAVADCAVFHLYLDTRINLGRLPNDVQLHRKGEIVTVSGVDRELNKLTTLWDSKKGLPLFAGVEAEIPTPCLRIRLPRSAPLLALRYTIGAPGMQTKDGYAFIAIEKDEASFINPVATQGPDDDGAV